MAIGKGSMARAAKAVKCEDKALAEKKVTEDKVVNTASKTSASAEVKTEKKTTAKKTTAKKTTAKKPVAKAATSVITPDKQVVDLVSSEYRIEVGQEMPVYLL